MRDNCSGVSRKSPIRLRATIYKVGILRCVDIPAPAVRTLGGDTYIPVNAAVNGHSFRGNLVPSGGGMRRLYLNTAVRKPAGVDTGDSVDLTLALDTESRELPVPADLAEALDRRGEQGQSSWESFELLPPGLRREALQWLGAAKSAPTRNKRIRRVFEVLDREEKKRCGRGGAV
jgi:hypothetical protein